MPEGFGQVPIPSPARFDLTLGEFLLAYAGVVAAPDPDAMLLTFLQSTFEAAADLERWDRANLERATGPLGRPPDGC